MTMIHINKAQSGLDVLLITELQYFVNWSVYKEPSVVNEGSLGRYHRQVPRESKSSYNRSSFVSKQVKTNFPSRISEPYLNRNENMEKTFTRPSLLSSLVFFTAGLSCVLGGGQNLEDFNIKLLQCTLYELIIPRGL